MAKLPLIALTMGDAAGIGPEIVVKALAHAGVYQFCRPLVIGTAWALEDALRFAATPLAVRPVASAADVRGDHGVIDVLDTGSLRREDVVVGKVSAACGRAAVACIEQSARLALEGAVDAITTSPINKESVHEAGFVQDIGHQEILARMSGATKVSTVLMTKGLRVVHLSTHKPLAAAVRHVTKDNVLASLALTQETFALWGMEHPRIAVAGLNPHGGEGGLLGREEIDELAPAVQEAQAKGIDARGPFPADSVFYRAINGEFDVVLALYHDQGHIAIKVHGFEDSVTANLGLPFIRTSVDHGTAFDIAGKGVANERSLLGAIEMAITLATRSLGKTPAQERIA